MKRSICTCHGCNAKIVFMSTETGRLIPVDWKPELENVEEFDKDKMTTHFATCSYAGQFRKKTPKKEKRNDENKKSAT